jgi:glutamate N-acetyltransferase/amino-acid N-acetyltransferase
MTDVKPTIESVPGFKVAGVHAGLKAEGALDFALIYSETPCVAAGVFTTNQVKAAPVLVDQERLQKNPTSIRAVAINTKCANACTGQQGIDNALQTARWVAERLGCAEDEVLVMSTGVIGTQLPMDKISRGVDLAVDALGDNNWEAAATAIMTTDTRPKMASFCSQYGYQIAGIAKGSGMIAPNMATMLGVVVTDASVDGYDARIIQDVLKDSADRTFNCIAVDGDTSTNDTVLLLANGASTQSLNNNAFEEELRDIAIKLAKEIVRDGEGATKFITVAVRGAGKREAAKQVANTIATSPLVKTAFYGGDANWGRIVAAAGRSGISVDPFAMHLWITPGEQPREDLLLFENGMPANYNEAKATEVMKEPSISVLLDCGQEGPHAIIWTCDLSHDYVSINGHYRT